MRLLATDGKLSDLVVKEHKEKLFLHCMATEIQYYSYGACSYNADASWKTLFQVKSHLMIHLWIVSLVLINSSNDITPPIRFCFYWIGNLSLYFLCPSLSLFVFMDFPISRPLVLMRRKSLFRKSFKCCSNLIFYLKF